MNQTATSETIPELYFCDHPGKLLLLDRKAIDKQKRQAIRDLHELNYVYNLKIPFFLGYGPHAGFFSFRQNHCLYICRSIF